MADEYIRKESVIDVARKYFDMIGLNPEILVDSFITMPPADVVPTEPQEIGYDQCANAMLKMWIDNVVTDGEYNRIMDRLNKLYFSGGEKKE